MGAFIGGALVESVGWEWVFFVNVPIGFLTIGGVLRAVPESRDL